MEDKYNLTRAENIFIAKKKLIENIYSGAKVERVTVTYLQTKSIVEGRNVSELTLDDILVIQNLKDAWRYTLHHIDDELNLDFICKINSFVSRNESLEWGVLRTGDVGIGGTDYKPEIPQEKIIKEELANILQSNKTETEKGVELYLYCCKKQLFWDGNKRTSFIVANKHLISKGKGLLTILDKDIDEYDKHLTAYYDDDKNLSRIKEFVFDKMLNKANFERGALQEMCATAPPSAKEDKEPTIAIGAKEDVLEQ